MEKLLAYLLSKVILKSVSAIEKQDYATALLRRLWGNRKARLVWPAICDAGESFFKDMANEFRDAKDFPERYPDEV